MTEASGASRRLRVAGLGALALGLLLAPVLLPPTPRLVWNASASSPVGIYRVSPSAPIGRGDMAVAWPPRAARALGAARGYLPGNVPLVKRVAASAGDRVCALGAAIFVGGRKVAFRLRADPSGRPLPWRWHGCVRLDEGSVLLLSPDQPLAFDGRYFGPSRGGEVLGRARLLWPR